MSSLEAAAEMTWQLAHEQIIWPVVILTAVCAPILALLTIVAGLASFGASFGLRKMYVKALLKIFQVGDESFAKVGRESHHILNS